MTEWTRWRDKDILGALSKKDWRTFRELQNLLSPGTLPWVGVSYFKATVRRLVTDGVLEVRPRCMVGVRRGRGPDEFRRVR